MIRRSSDRRQRRLGIAATAGFLEPYSLQRIRLGCRARPQTCAPNAVSRSGYLRSEPPFLFQLTPLPPGNYLAEHDSARPAQREASRPGNGSVADQDEQDVKPALPPSPLPRNGDVSAAAEQIGNSPQRSLRKDSPLPFQDVASPDSSMSSIPPSAAPALSTMTPQRESTIVRDSSAEEGPWSSNRTTVGLPAPTPTPPMQKTVSSQHVSLWFCFQLFPSPFLVTSLPLNVCPPQPPPAWLQSLFDHAHKTHPGEKPVAVQRTTARGR